jgi:lipooligosaccharide transport system permease protein
VSALAPSYDFFNYYVTLLITPMFIFSGVFYPITTLPEFAQVIVQLLPLSHAIALIRPLVAGQPVEQVALHIGVLLFYAIAGYMAATVFIRRRLIK